MASSIPLTESERSTTVYQPLDPEVRPRLDPEYVAFHDKYTQYVEPDDTEDINLDNFPVRVFRPDGDRPKNGWPVLVWYHGGGWAIGSIESENDFCSRMCRDASCVVVTVGYRLAPEHPYPIPVEDALEALVWVHSEAGSRILDIDRARIAIGGTSAGGNLSAVTLLKASLLPEPIPLIFQLLIVPVVDNTATTSTIWASRAKAPWLTPARMTWYRDMYIRDPSDARRWDASPNLAPASLLAKTPRTWLAVAEQDLLAPEGRAFADQLRAAGVEVAVVSYQGMTHSILAMNGILSKGKQLVDDAAKALKNAFGLRAD